MKKTFLIVLMFCLNVINAQSIEKEKVDNETVAAKITFIHIVGPTVQIELKREDNGEFLEAELTKEHYKNLEIQKGDIVYVRPKQLKVFIPEDFSI